MLVLLPWYLNKLHLEVVNLIIHLLKVLLHPFDLAFMVPIDLAGYNLRIAVHNHICSSCHLGKIQPRYQSFILCLVISRREIKTDHAFDLIPFQAVEYHTSNACLLVGRSIRVNAPLGSLFYPLVFREGEFCDEVSNNLSLYSHMWLVLYVEFTQLNRP